jgi:hypothetical protein
LLKRPPNVRFLVGDADNIGLAGLLLANGDFVDDMAGIIGHVLDVKRRTSIERSMVSMAVENRAKSLKFTIGVERAFDELHLLGREGALLADRLSVACQVVRFS